MKKNPIVSSLLCLVRGMVRHRRPVGKGGESTSYMMEHEIYHGNSSSSTTGSDQLAGRNSNNNGGGGSSSSNNNNYLHQEVELSPRLEK